jgi:hypothetical protein
VSGNRTDEEAEMFKLRAKALFSEWRPLWIVGDGQYASLAFCNKGLSVMLHSDRDKAEKAKAEIDKYGCGGRCTKKHAVADLLDIDLDDLAIRCCRPPKRNAAGRRLEEL